jgi:chromosome partitioning protein
VKKIAIIAQKGGVGKTAIAVNLAVAASKRLKVALFDLDSQESVIGSDYRKLDRRMWNS